ncbi:MAG: MerR family transcriptional regulator [Segetibacter sp.]|jgi:hypothetical protein|nr:MerR family transcriptional regulator [Segetibacter sp.]
MQTDDLILAEELCSHYKVELSFISSLQQFGLIEVTSVEEAAYVPQRELQKLEQIARLHYDLDINLEGIDAISHLLDRIKSMQSEITFLKNRLSMYERR